MASAVARRARHWARGAAAFAGALGASASAFAQAASPDASGDAVHVDVTDASSVLYNFDNRDSRQSVVTRANDHWGLWYNRLNLQGSWGKWQFGVRVDNAWFYTSPSHVQVALDLWQSRPRPLPPGSDPDSVYFRRSVDDAGIELSNRYINWVYPSKYYVGYTTRDVELTFGDFYAQLGRGFVLSVRKMDELASDTTVRGTRATGRLKLGDVRVRLTGLGGELNPLRIDEASGRYLGVGAEGRTGWLGVTEAGMPRAVETDYARAADCRDFATCGYAPDRIAAAQIEVATDTLKLGTQGSLLVRQESLTEDASRSAGQILIGSQSIEFPDFDGHGTAYAEVALQDMRRDGEPTLRNSDGTSMGHAAYASVSLIQEPVTVTVEGKHYRRFFPLGGNVSLTHAREFSLVQYSAPPTTEAFWVDSTLGDYNTCVSGGRAKTDVQVGADESLFVWAGRWSSWAESVSNDGCDIGRDKENRVWDLATGVEITSQGHRSRASVTLGARVDEAPDARFAVPGGKTSLYYQEGYVRYDVIRSLGGPFALQFQGWHRRRRETDGQLDSWFEGQHLTGFEFAPHLLTAVGFEYDTRPNISHTYFNGQLSWRFSSDTSVSLFVGQRRGALRCVGGVCRVFPPFEGARLDATVRF